MFENVIFSSIVFKWLTVNPLYFLFISTTIYSFEIFNYIIYLFWALVNPESGAYDVGHMIHHSKRYTLGRWRNSLNQKLEWLSSYPLTPVILTTKCDFFFYAHSLYWLMYTPRTFIPCCSVLDVLRNLLFWSIHKRKINHCFYKNSLIIILPVFIFFVFLCTIN